MKMATTDVPHRVGVCSHANFVICQQERCRLSFNPLKGLTQDDLEILEVIPRILSHKEGCTSLK